MLRQKTMPQEDFPGTINFRCPALLTIITSTPASVKRTPAKSIWDQVSSGPMENNSYPILMDGKALPHRKQQSSASRHTVPVFCKYVSFECFMYLDSL